MRGRSQGRPSCISQVQMWKVCPLTVLGPHEINCLQRNIWFTASHCLEKPFWVQSSDLLVSLPVLHILFAYLLLTTDSFWSTCSSGLPSAACISLPAFLQWGNWEWGASREVDSACFSDDCGVQTAQLQTPEWHSRWAERTSAEDRWPITWNMSASVTTQPHLLCTPYSPC